MTTWLSYHLHESNSPLSDKLMQFYLITMIMIIFILLVVNNIMISIILNKYTNRFLLKNHMLEIIWTIMPMIILVMIAIPSLKTLYYIDEIWNPTFFTIKCIAHQWYWTYEYPEFNNIEFNSYILTELKINSFRLLDVDNRMIIPMNLPIRVLTTSSDVIHSWTVPSLGVKMDSIPGRINQMTLFSMRPGLYYGQCSEICGTNHSFMPITLESTTYSFFLNWVKSFYWES